jgi:ferrous iron transport protein B
MSEEAALFAIVGNPNCGKTTLFNALTGLRQKVANYPGVTVEKKVGECISQHGKRLRIIDLPGAYSLNARSPDEAVLRDVLLGRQKDTPRPEKIICVLDASNLERNLYLTTQIMDLGLPTIVVLNMMDVAAANGLRVDPDALAAKLGVPVIPMQASTGQGLLALRLAMSRSDLAKPSLAGLTLPQGVQRSLEQCREELAQAGVVRDSATLWEALYLLGEHDPSHFGIDGMQHRLLATRRQSLMLTHEGWEDEVVAARYANVSTLCKDVVRHPETQGRSATDRIDAVLLHPVWGGLIFLGVLALLVWSMFSLAETPMGWIEGWFQSASEWVKASMAEGDLRDLITEGVIAGVSGVVVFLPQIMILFFFIGIMEDTGYMARIAFIMDRVMAFAGLNGKAFLPFLSSYACAVPGIMASRTIDNPKDRLITLLVTPLASCSARLPVYLVLIAAMFPVGTVSSLQKTGILVGLYATGTLAAFGFAWFFNRKLMKNSSSPMILEMPAYKRPSLRSILLHVWERARLFLVRAGTVIVGVTVLIWAACTYPKTDGDASTQLSQSIAGRLGHLIEPVIKPLGYDWKIGIGIISSTFSAREIFPATMRIVYSVEGEDEDDVGPIRDRLVQERHADGRAVYTPLVCLSLMAFYIFAMQCVGTMAVVRRETAGWKWPLIQFGYMTGTGYLLALIIYQGGKLLGYV